MIWNILLIVLVATLLLSAASWLASFLRRDGPVPFPEVFPASMCSLFLVSCLVAVTQLFHGTVPFALLGTFSVGWLLSVLMFRLTLEITLSESLLMAAAGWLTILAVGFLLFGLPLM